jgi:hypothetical protein
MAFTARPALFAEVASRVAEALGFVVLDESTAVFADDPAIARLFDDDTSALVLMFAALPSDVLQPLVRKLLTLLAARSKFHGRRFAPCVRAVVRVNLGRTGAVVAVCLAVAAVAKAWRAGIAVRPTVALIAKAWRAGIAVWPTVALIAESRRARITVRFAVAAEALRIARRRRWRAGIAVWLAVAAKALRIARWRRRRRIVSPVPDCIARLRLNVLDRRLRLTELRSGTAVLWLRVAISAPPEAVARRWRRRCIVAPAPDIAARIVVDGRLRLTELRSGAALLRLRVAIPAPPKAVA